MAEATFEAVKDTSLNAASPTTNYNAANLFLGLQWSGGAKSALYRTLINFDVSSLAGEQIIGARLVREIIDVVGSGGHDAVLYRCTRPDTWVETEATWNNYKSGSAWTAAGGDFSTTTPVGVTFLEPTIDELGPHSVTGLKAFVDDAIANRSGIVALLLRLVDESSLQDDALTTALRREHPFPTGRPNLIVEYGEAGVLPATERRFTDQSRQVGTHGEARPARGARSVAVPAGVAPTPPGPAARPARVVPPVGMAR